MKPDATYRADIDGLRGVAVAIVIVFHAAHDLLPGGFVGVDVFFVISGYLISRFILVEIEDDGFSFIDFYLRRARRLFPALATVLITTLIIGWFVLFPAAYARLGRETMAAVAFAPNVLFWGEGSTYFGPSAIEKPLLHLWSLGVEEQFYLVWPLLLLLMLKLTSRVAWIIGIVVASSFVYSIYARDLGVDAAFYSPLSRVWELGAGAFLAATRAERWRLSRALRTAAQAIGVALIAVSACFEPQANGLTASLPLLGAVVGSALVIAMPAAPLGVRPLRRLGLISYPLYLWHWPLISFGATVGIVGIGGKAVIVGLSIALSEVTFRFIETPIRYGSYRWWGLIVASGAMVSAAAAAGVVFLSTGIPLRYPQDIRPVLAFESYRFSESARAGRCWIAPEAQPLADYSAECGQGDVVIWGDSYAARLYSAFDPGRPVGQFTRASCAPIIRPFVDGCITGNAAVLDELIRLRPRTVILFAAWLADTNIADGNVEYVEGFNKVLARLTPVIEDVIVLGVVPDWDPYLPRAVYEYWRQAGELPDRLTPAPRKYAEGDAILRKIAERHGARFIPLLPALCNAEGCLTHTPLSRNDLISWDRGHFTDAGAKYVASLLGLVD